MSNLSKQHQLTSRLNRDDTEIILELIDLKTEGDMEKVLTAIDSAFDKLNRRIDSMEASSNAQFFALNSRIDNLEKGFDTRLTSLEKSVDARFNAMNHKLSLLYWLIGLAIPTAIGIAKFL